MRPKTNTPLSNKVISKFEDHLRSLRQGQFAPSMLVTIMANINMLGADIPANLFRSVNYNVDFEMPSDAIVLGELFKRIEGGRVNIDKPERRRVGDYVIQTNMIRGYRPTRSAKKSKVPLNIPFDSSGFHYAIPEVEHEVFFPKVINNHLTVDLIMNRYPFCPWHSLWVPDRHAGHNQFLDPKEDTHILACALDFVQGGGPDSPIRLAYNSMGAHASVNHLHFHCLVLAEDWEPPFELKVVSNPISHRFHGGSWLKHLHELTDFINEMNQRDIPYHFYIHPLGIAVFPRKSQGDSRYLDLLNQTSFTTGFAFMEFVGEFISPTEKIPSDSNEIKKRIEELYDALSV